MLSERTKRLSLKNNKRLVHITTVPLSLRFFSGQIGYMKAQGFQVVCISSPGELLNKFAEQEQVSVYAIEMSRRITPLRDLFAIFQLWQRLQLIRPIIVHAHTPKGGLLGLIAAWLAGVPVRIFHIHGLPSMTATGNRRILLQWSERVACLLAHQVFCVSPSVREVAIRESLCPASKVKVLLKGGISGVDAAVRFHPVRVGETARLNIRRKYGIPFDALVVGFVGRIVRDKGLVELAAAWKALREEFSSLHLLVVGPFEPQDPVPLEVEDLLRSDPRIHLTGWADDMPPLYAAMDILALPSYREGFGLVAIEASAMELPVVVTRIPGCVDAVKDGVTGMQVPPQNAHALADVIRMYLTDVELRSKHGQAGRECVLRDFRPEASWAAQYQEYVRLLCEKGLTAPKPWPVVKVPS
jgi:glycosyltransferase involved in cell wall biosynthesis